MSLLAIVAAGTAATVATLGSSGAAWWLKQAAGNAVWRQSVSTGQCPPCPQCDGTFTFAEAQGHMRNIDGDTLLTMHKLYLVTVSAFSYAVFFWIGFGFWWRSGASSHEVSRRKPRRGRSRSVRTLQDADIERAQTQNQRTERAALQNQRDLFSGTSVRELKSRSHRVRSLSRRHAVAPSDESPSGQSSADPVAW